MRSLIELSATQPTISHRKDPSSYCRLSTSLRLVNDQQQSLLIDDVIGALKWAFAEMVQRLLRPFLKVDPDYGEGVALSLGALLSYGPMLFISIT
jgi:catalase